ncbi:hypothetical protein ACHAXS_007276 [Conticribra weissflogii]
MTSTDNSKRGRSYNSNYPGIKPSPSAQSSVTLTYSADESFSFPESDTNSRNMKSQIPSQSQLTNQARSHQQDPGPAYEFQRSERPRPGTAANVASGASYATSTEDSVDFSSYSGYSGFSSELAHGVGGVAAATGMDAYYYGVDGSGGGLATVNEYNHQQPLSHDGGHAANNGSTADVFHDATATVHDMHKQLLHLLSHPELFHESIAWQRMLDRGLDPSIPSSGNGGEGGNGSGIRAFDHEFEEEEGEDEEESEVDGGGRRGMGERKQGDRGENDKAMPQTPDKSVRSGKSMATPTSISKSFSNQETQQNSKSNNVTDKNDGKSTPKRLSTPLPHRIFASDAEVVLPQALTASQLFGMERFTGIELEAAAGLEGLSLLFLRWLALMPEGDHMNIIEPPGLTVMRIAGGRYRVTAAHRVVWRWMNKFSPASAFQSPPESQPAVNANDPSDPNSSSSNKSQVEEPNDTDFDFGDLVTMTIIDVFETDNDGKLLSYCPTFDNRAVHKTQESIERLRKGASQLREIARSPAGVKVNKAAGSLGKMSLNAALTVRDIVRHRIEEEIHKHQHNQNKQKTDSDTSADAVGGEDVAEEDDDETEGGAKSMEGGKLSPPALETEPSRDDDHSGSVPASGKSAASGRGEHYFSDDSTAA